MAKEEGDKFFNTPHGKEGSISSTLESEEKDQDHLQQQKMMLRSQAIFLLLCDTAHYPSDRGKNFRLF